MRLWKIGSVSKTGFLLTDASGAEGKVGTYLDELERSRLDVIGELRLVYAGRSQG